MEAVSTFATCYCQELVYFCMHEKCALWISPHKHAQYCIYRILWYVVSLVFPDEVMACAGSVPAINYLDEK